MDIKRTADEARNGVVETHFGNGQLWSRANYKDDIASGLCEFWHRDGKPMGRVTYKDGVVVR